MQSPPFPRYLIPPRSKHSPQHNVLKHSQLPFLPQCQRPIFTPIQTWSLTLRDERKLRESLCNEKQVRFLWGGNWMRSTLYLRELKALILFLFIFFSNLFSVYKFSCCYLFIYCCKVKAIPLQAWTGPEGSRSLRLQDFKTIGTWRW